MLEKAKPKHVHKLKRHRYKSGTEVYFCALPDCSIKFNPPLALGKRSICWRCGEEFIMTEYSIRLAKPHCDACHKPKIEGSVDKVVGGNEPSSFILDELPNLPITSELTLAERLQKTLSNQSPIDTITEEEI